MTGNEACPDEKQLETLLDHSLTSEEELLITQHIGRCRNCQDFLDDISQIPLIEQNQSLPLQNSIQTGKLEELFKQLKRLEISEQTTSNSKRYRTTDRSKPRPREDLSLIRERLDDEGFDLESEIGRGGMGVVYKAWQRSLERHVAIKVLAAHLAHNDEAVERFLRESKAAASIDHPNVVTVHAVSQSQSFPFIVMEYVDGYAISTLLNQAKEKVSFEDTRRIGAQLASALEAAHRVGIVHRDVKPANVLVNRKTGKVLLGDFGLAKSSAVSSITQTGVLAGSPAYVAPETLEGEGDHRSDLFSLGVLLYESVAGMSPFESDSVLSTLYQVSVCKPKPIMSIRPDCPVRLAEVIQCLMVKDVEKRIQSASQARKELKAARADFDASSGPIIPNPIPVIETRSGAVQRRKTNSLRTHFAVVTMALSLLLIVIFSIVFWGDRKPAESTDKLASSDSTLSRQAKPKQVLQLNDATGESSIKTGSKQIPSPFVTFTSTGEKVASFLTLQVAIAEMPEGGSISVVESTTVFIDDTIEIEGDVEITGSENHSHENHIRSRRSGRWFATI